MDTNSQTLNVPESLDISQVDIPELPKDIIFPDELNRFFREQIRYYVHENGMLQKNLSDSELIYNTCKTKIKDLENKLKHYEKACDGNDMLSATQVASIKIVELSKKLREKNSEVEVLKTKNSRLEQRVCEMQIKPEEHKEIEKEEKPVNELAETVKRLQDKLNFTTNKMLETKNANLQLKNDIKMANKWLQQEIGENFETMQSLNNNGNWRGRSQVICDLQQKNAEMRERIKDLQDKRTILAPTKTDSKISVISRENNELKTQYEDIKRKYDALRARCKVLDTDYTILKSKCIMLKEQSERDQEIISTLSCQISSTRDIKSDVLQQKDMIINTLQNDKNGLTKELEEYKSLTKKFKEDLEKKNAEIEKLKTTRPYSGSGNLQNTNKNLGLLEVERQRLLELVEVQNKRLKSERDSHAKTQYLLRFERQRSAKAEASAARIEIESNSSRSSSYSTPSLRPLDFGLKDQLELAEENIKALKTRLEIEHFERSTDLQEFSKILQSFDDKQCQSGL